MLNECQIHAFLLSCLSSNCLPQIKDSKTKSLVFDSGVNSTYFSGAKEHLRIISNSNLVSYLCFEGIMSKIIPGDLGWLK